MHADDLTPATRVLTPVADGHHTERMGPGWRSQQRAQLIARRMAVPLGVRRRHNTVITEILLQSFAVRPGAIVALYWPFKGEFDPRFLVRQWRATGARAALPVVVRKDAPLELSRIASIHPQPHDIPMDVVVTETGPHSPREFIQKR